MKRRLIIALLAGVLLGLVAATLSLLHASQAIEDDLGLGILFKLRGTRTPPPDVAVVSIDSESSDRLDVSDDPDRWPRSLHARLIKKLVDAGAKVIAFDVFFIEPKSAQDDRALIAAVREAGNVVLCEPLVAKEVPAHDAQEVDTGGHSIVRVVKPFAPLAQSAAVTAPFVLPRIPFKVNQYWTFQTGAGDAPTLPVAALQLFAMPVYEDFLALLKQTNPVQAATLPPRADTALRGRGLYGSISDLRAIFESDPTVGQRMLELLAHTDPAAVGAAKHRLLKALVNLYAGPNRRYVNYYGPPRTIATIPYHQALKLGEPGEGKPAIAFKDKLVFVGLSEKLLAERKDSFYTVFAQANGVFIGGVEIAATATLNMLEGAQISMSAPLRLLTFLLCGALLAVICRMLNTTVAAVLVVGLAIAYLAAAAQLFASHGAWYPIVIPLFVQAPVAFFGVMFWNYAETSRERKRMRKALAYYVPDEIVDQLVRNRLDMKSGGQTVEGACLFADIAGYTSLSEKMSPRALSDLMQRYFDAAFGPVQKHGGLIAQLKGDSFLAIWKATRTDASMRRNACLAALEVAAAVRAFNASLPDLKLPTRIGVHSGQLFLGNIGGGEHYEYGATGDVVNTASRMDGLNKYLGTEVLVSAEVLQGLDGFLTREAGAFRFKGKAQPVVVHELICLLDRADSPQRAYCEQFAEALLAFRRQSWSEAREKFKQLVLHSPADGPAYYYLQLCGEYQSNPPEQSWEGVVLLAEK